VIGKLPVPANMEAERAVLGAAIFADDGAAAAIVVRDLDVADFHLPAHGEILKALRALGSKFAPADRVSVLTEMKAQGTLPALEGGEAYLARLAMESPTATAANIQYWIDLVKEAARRRALMADLSRLIRQAAEGSADVEELQRAVERVAVRLRDAGSTAEQTFGEIINDAVALMENRATGRSKPISTGWAGMDAALNGGIWPGLLYVLAAASGVGKTQWALQIALRALLTGVPTLYLGLELGKVDVAVRLMTLLHQQKAAAAHKPRPSPWSDYYWGKPTEADRTALYKLQPELSRLPVKLEVAPSKGWSADLLLPTVRRLREKYPETDGIGTRPILVVLDYLQVVAATPGDHAELRERIGQAAYAGRAVARDLGVAVILLSSVSRDSAITLSEDAKVRSGENVYVGSGTKRTLKKRQDDPRAWLQVAKEAGEIEFATDAFIAMGPGKRFDYDKDTGESAHTEMHLAIAKQRAGIEAWVKLKFDGGGFWDENTTPIPRKKGPVPGVGRR